MSKLGQNIYVVGGGPAGLAAAIALKRIGCSVTVVDCAVPPIDKACGEGLLPDSLVELRKLGIEVSNETGFPFRGIRFADRHSSACADFPTGIAKGVRRIVLHRLLIEHANGIGVSFIWDAKHVRLMDRGLCLDDRFLRADLVVGADGQNSKIRESAGLNVVTREKRRYAFRKHYRIAPWASYMEVHWASKAQIYVTPVATDEVCVAVVSRESNVRLQEALSDFPELNSRLKTAETVSSERGALSVSRSLKSVCSKNVVLIGDASGSIDAITGEGICVSLKQAHALAAAVQSCNLALYQQLHLKLMRRPQTMASLMLTLDGNAQLQRRVLAAFARNPEVFRSLLAVHVGAAQFRHLWSWSLVDFGRAFLAA